MDIPLLHDDTVKKHNESMWCIATALDWLEMIGWGVYNFTDLRYNVEKLLIFNLYRKKMPIIKSAKKAARQADKRTKHNQEIKKDIKNALKAFKANPSKETLAKAQSEYDKAVKKDLLKKNTASRRKAKLHKILKEAKA